MELPIRPLRADTDASNAVIEASLWLRLGFFSGSSIAAVALIRYVEGASGLLLSLASAVVGAALAVFSVRRGLGLLERENASAREAVSPAERSVLSQS